MLSRTKALLDAATQRADMLRTKGKAVDFDEFLRMEPDSGTINVRHISSAHWKRWLGFERRCLVLFTRFSEFTLRICRASCSGPKARFLKNQACQESGRYGVRRRRLVDRAEKRGVGSW